MFITNFGFLYQIYFRNTHEIWPPFSREAKLQNPNQKHISRVLVQSNNKALQNGIRSSHYSLENIIRVKKDYNSEILALNATLHIIIQNINKACQILLIYWYLPKQHRPIRNKIL